MAKDNFFVVACRILTYLYACLRAGEKVDGNAVSPDKLGISPRYWISVLSMMTDEGYIKGVRFSETLGNIYEADLRDASITIKGIEMLENNTMMAKARDFIKGLKEIVPGW